MLENQNFIPAARTGSVSDIITLDMLPPPSTTRWVVRRKAEVVMAVKTGLLNMEEACDRYSISREEFAGWQQAIQRGGLAGLRVTQNRMFR